MELDMKVNGKSYIIKEYLKVERFISKTRKRYLNMARWINV
jgi:hypothetical protein